MLDSMKRIICLVMVYFITFSVMAFSPVVEGFFYGGEILYHNSSSYNLYMELELSGDTDGVGYDKNLCLEKNDRVVNEYQIYTDNEPAVMPGDPNDAYRKIRFYDMGSGLLLKELTVAGDIFVKTGGSLENLDAVFELIITDSFLTGVYNE